MKIGVLGKWKDFKKYLDENYYICENTKQVYTRSINSFFNSHRMVTQGTIIKFLETHRRVYYLQSLKYYCEYQDIKNIKFPKARAVEAPEIDQITYPRKSTKEILNKLIPKIEQKKYFDLKYILLIYFHTGARCREVLELKYKDFKFKKENEKSFIWFSTKGNKKRKVYLSDNFSQELYDYFAKKGLIENMYCFYGNYTKASKNRYEEDGRGILLLRQVKIMKFLQELRTVDEEAFNLFRKTHSFRRTTINELKKRGLDIYDISQFIGHISTNTTQKYFSQATKEEAIKKGFKALNSEE